VLSLATLEAAPFPDSGSFANKTFPGWSTINNVTYGGIAAFRNFVYVTDTYSAVGRAKGIVRFDLVNNTAQRFAAEAEVIDLNIGLDGNLYGLAPSPGCSVARTRHRP
jgi:hypothetical protein